jgi:hypothetical protein
MTDYDTSAAAKKAAPKENATGTAETPGQPSGGAIPEPAGVVPCEDLPPPAEKPSAATRAMADPRYPEMPHHTRPDIAPYLPEGRAAEGYNLTDLPRREARHALRPAQDAAAFPADLAREVLRVTREDLGPEAAGGCARRQTCQVQVRQVSAHHLTTKEH